MVPIPGLARCFFCEDFFFFLLEGKESESFMIRTCVIASESTGNGTLNCDKYFLFLKQAIALQVFGKAEKNLDFSVRSGSSFAQAYN